jgi:hypothetical protein
MPSRPGKQRHVTRCAVCNGQFGLVRHHRWRTPLCSMKCVDRCRARWESDRIWFQIAFDPLPDIRQRRASVNLVPQNEGFPSGRGAR